MLGEEHPSTLSARHNLAQQIGNQGRYKEAEEEFRAIWDIRRRPEVLGEEHPSCLRTRYWLARMLDAQGHTSEADGLLSGLEDAMLRQLDPGHKYVQELRAYLRDR